MLEALLPMLVCVFGNSTKNNSLYSPDPIGSILATVIRTFLSVNIYMMKVPYMFIKRELEAVLIHKPEWICTNIGLY